MRCSGLVLLILGACAALSARPPHLDLSITARSIAHAFDACDSGETCDVATVDEFVVAAAAAFETCSLGMLLMELDVADDANIGDTARDRRRTWLRAIRTTLDYVNESSDKRASARLSASSPRDDEAGALLRQHVARVVDAASERGLQFEKQLAAADAAAADDVPVDHLILLTMRACCYRDEDEPGATG